MANPQVGHLVLATGPVRPGYQHSTATYVEGREAPRRFPESLRRIAGRLPSSTEVDVTDDGYRLRDHEVLLAEYKHSDVHNARAIISAMLDGLAMQMRQPPAPDAATVEACAMEAEAEWARLCELPAWGKMTPHERWSRIARAVLAAAARGAK